MDIAYFQELDLRHSHVALRQLFGRGVRVFLKNLFQHIHNVMLVEELEQLPIEFQVFGYKIWLSSAVKRGGPAVTKSEIVQLKEQGIWRP